MRREILSCVLAYPYSDKSVTEQASTSSGQTQAKRVVARLDRFKEAILDFEGVTAIGQAFADEIFRVFQSEYPELHVTWVNANEEVSSMIGRVQSSNSRS